MENIFKWFKCNRKLISLLFILFFIIIPIIPFIQSPIGILTKEDAVIFIDYYGTIIAGLSGGALTLFGVWWTIQDQNNKRILDKSAEYRPILNFGLCPCNDSNRKSYNIFSDKPLQYSLHFDTANDTRFFSYLIDLCNIGRAEAINLQFISIKLEINYHIYDFSYILNNIHYAELLSNYKIFINFELPINESLYSDLIKVNTNNTCTITLQISYEDIYGMKSYRDLICQSHNLLYNETTLIFTTDDDNSVCVSQ